MIFTDAISTPELSKAVDLGLSRHPKVLPSWLLYDEAGSRLFNRITETPEYYPTRAEHEIITTHQEDLLYYFQSVGKPFHLVELGAGDGRKAEILLKCFDDHRVPCSYYPVDVSRSALDLITTRLHAGLPQLTVNALHRSYEEALVELAGHENKVLLFLGSNIGNFTLEEAAAFLKRVADFMKGSDLALIGFDLKKDPHVIERAYNDAEGITREFNLNLLRRLNHELGADFTLQQFAHYPFYDPQTGMARSFLISLVDQTVHIAALEKTYRFFQWESLNTEISMKYDLITVEKLLSQAELEIVDLFFDSSHFFCDVLIKRG